jgi:hypothetical protein
VQGTTEIWSYPSKDGEVQAMTSTGQGWASGKSAPAQQAYCTVNIAMAAGRVSKVSYVGPDGEALAPTARCTFALQNCIQ